MLSRIFNSLAIAVVCLQPARHGKFWQSGAPPLSLAVSLSVDDNDGLGLCSIFAIDFALCLRCRCCIDRVIESLLPTISGTVPLYSATRVMLLQIVTMTIYFVNFTGFYLSSWPSTEILYHSIKSSSLVTNFYCQFVCRILGSRVHFRW